MAAPTSWGVVCELVDRAAVRIKRSWRIGNTPHLEACYRTCATQKENQANTTADFARRPAVKATWPRIVVCHMWPPVRGCRNCALKTSVALSVLTSCAPWKIRTTNCISWNPYSARINAFASQLGDKRIPAAVSAAIFREQRSRLPVFPPPASKRAAKCTSRPKTLEPASVHANSNARNSRFSGSAKWGKSPSVSRR